MKRKKSLFFVGVSVSILLASSLLVACTSAGATGPGESTAASSLSQAESESVSVAASSVPASSSRSTSQSQSSRPARSSSEASNSAPSSQAPATQTPVQTAPQAQAPTSQSECVPEPTPTPAPEPAPAPTPSANIDACLSAAAGWASGNNMAVNDGLSIGGAGHENPVETNGKTDAQVTEHLTYQLGLIRSQITAMPDFNSDTVYPCYKFVVDGTLIYVLYG